MYVDCPVAAKREKSAPSYTNKKLPVGLPEALIFPDGILGKAELLGMLDCIPCNAVLLICVHRFGHSIGVTGLSPSLSTSAASPQHAHVRVLNIQEIDQPPQRSAAAAAAAAAAASADHSTAAPPPGYTDIAGGGGGLPRHIVAAVAGAQVCLRQRPCQRQMCSLGCDALQLGEELACRRSSGGRAIAEAALHDVCEECARFSKQAALDNGIITLSNLEGHVVAHISHDISLDWDRPALDCESSLAVDTISQVSGCKRVSMLLWRHCGV